MESQAFLFRFFCCFLFFKVCCCVDNPIPNDVVFLFSFFLNNETEIES